MSKEAAAAFRIKFRGCRGLDESIFFNVSVFVSVRFFNKLIYTLLLYNLEKIVFIQKEFTCGPSPK